MIVQDQELKHYGILGMRWGVRRSRKQLERTSTSEQRSKAISNLEKHKEKGTAKVAKLEKKGAKLEKKKDKMVVKNDAKAWQMKQESANLRMKAYAPFTSKKRSAKRIYQANKLEAKADYMIANSQKAKAKVERNKTMIEAFKKELSTIDATLVVNGKKYTSGK